MTSTPLPGTSLPGADLEGLLADWHARGLPQQDPLRYHFAVALARRAAALPAGPVRQRLETRLAQLLQALTARLGEPAAAAAATRHEEAAGARPAPLAALAALTRRLADAAADPPATAGAAGPAGLPAAARPELKALRQHRRTWSRLAVARRLQQSQAQAPGQAGPLHSQALVLRGLGLMQELSPDYLARFVAYADSLLWLEAAHGAPALPARDVLGPAPAERPARKPRQRPG